MFGFQHIVFVDREGPVADPRVKVAVSEYATGSPPRHYVTSKARP